MLVKRITKISNPRRRVAARKRTNPRKRLTPKQIKFFGSKAQRAALKRKRSNPKRHRMATNVRRPRPARNTHRRRLKRVARNPVHLLNFAAGVNPKPRKKRRITKMAVTKKRRRVRRTAAKSNPRRRRRVMKVNSHRSRRVMKASNPKRRRRNTRVIVRNPHRRRHNTRRNPSLFGQSNGFEIGKMLVGGLAGVTITKAVPNMLPSSLTSSPLMRVATSTVTALLSGYLFGKFVDKTVGDSVTFGGLMQSFSVALNSFLPSVGATIGLQGLGGGLGDLIAGNYPVPQNPLFPQYNPPFQQQIAAPMGAHAAAAGPSMTAAPSTAGVTGIFGSAWGIGN